MPASANGCSEARVSGSTGWVWVEPEAWTTGRATLWSWPTRLGQRSDDHFLERGAGRHPHGEKDHLGYIDRVLQVALVRERDALLAEAIEEVSAHAARDDCRHPNVVRPAFDAEAAPEA